MSTLKDRLTDDMKQAMRAKDKERLNVLRMALAAIKQREVDERITLDDAQILAVLDKMIKQRKDSIDQFGKAGRDDLVATEAFELEVLQTYLPAPLTDAELDAMVAAAIAESGATSAKDMGQVMGVLKPRIQGRADMGAASQRVKASLS